MGAVVRFVTGAATTQDARAFGTKTAQRLTHTVASDSSAERHCPVTEEADVVKYRGVIQGGADLGDSLLRPVRRADSG